MTILLVPARQSEIIGFSGKIQGVIGKWNRLLRDSASSRFKMALGASLNIVRLRSESLHGMRSHGMNQVKLSYLSPWYVQSVVCTAYRHLIRDVEVAGVFFYKTS